MMPKLVSLFRERWAKTPGTTSASAPFGIVSLSSHDSEGAADMASFRWAQQGSYGTLPNKAMANTFMAHAFDLQDPWNGNTGACVTHPLPGYDCSTPWFMGPGIHPRLKKPVGQRLALGAMAHAYGTGAGTAGGVISGCSLKSSSSSSSNDSEELEASVLTLTFAMPAGRALKLRPYNQSNVALSAASVLYNGSWISVHLATLGGTSIRVVLPRGVNAPEAVRYAWGATGGDKKGTSPNGGDISCCEGDGRDAPCLMMQCPLHAVEPLAPFGGLPVDPFLAEIVGGKCVCPSPQICDE